jgi:carbonic anhydrase
MKEQEYKIRYKRKNQNPETKYICADSEKAAEATLKLEIGDCYILYIEKTGYIQNSKNVYPYK